MVLIVQDGCGFCKEFEDLKGLVIAKYLGNETPPVIELGGTKMPPPIQLVGFPTLLDGEKVYIGRDPVRARLEKFKRSQK